MHCPQPSWDADAGRLWFGERLLIEFRQPAPNQKRILDVFEEQHWLQAHIYDPLPRAEGESDDDAKSRLHQTIKNLNRNLPSGTIRIRGDGTGEGVRWEYAPVRRQRARRSLA